MPGPVPAVAQIYRVTYDLTMFNQKLMSTFTYRLSTVGTEVDTDAVCTALDTVLSAGANLQVKYRACLTPQVNIDNAWYQVIFPTRVRKVTVVKNVPGNFAGTSNTPNLAASIERRGVLANRHNMGRVQIPACDDGFAISNGTFPAGPYFTALLALAAQMLVPVTTLGGSVLGPVLVTNPISAAFVNIIEAVPKSTVRTMRRRTVGVGK